MRNPIDVLKLLTEKASVKGYTFERLYRNLYNPDFYLLAYKNIAASPGSMTTGADGLSIDNMSMARINKIIASLKDQTYQPNPARRTYIAKKNNPTKKRPLGIPSTNDKLAQEVIRMLLEAIYEPTFSNLSHGFRPKRSCHKTLKSIQITLVSRLEKFNLESLAGMTQTDEMELWSLGERKTAIFAVIPDNDSSFNFIVGMLYTQLFQQLYYQADVVHGGRLPVHVHFVMDEFANVALPDEFDKLLATMRSREISVSIIIQNLAQLKALFEKQWESIVGNCDEFIYLGGNEQATHEYVSKLLGKETIDTNTYGQSRGRSGSYSTNWQLAGRELLMPDEVRMLDNQYALLFIRGERPIQDFKYDILKHPNVKLTTDGGAEPYRHGEDTHSIASIQFDPELLKQAVEVELDAGQHRLILLTEEELEEYIINHGGNTQ